MLVNAHALIIIMPLVLRGLHAGQRSGPNNPFKNNRVLALSVPGTVGTRAPLCLGPNNFAASASIDPNTNTGLSAHPYSTHISFLK